VLRRGGRDLRERGYRDREGCARADESPRRGRSSDLEAFTQAWTIIQH